MPFFRKSFSFSFSTAPIDLQRIPFLSVWTRQYPFSSKQCTLDCILRCWAGQVRTPTDVDSDLLERSRVIINFEWTLVKKIHTPYTKRQDFLYRRLKYSFQHISFAEKSPRESWISQWRVMSPKRSCSPSSPSSPIWRHPCLYASEVRSNWQCLMAMASYPVTWKTPASIYKKFEIICEHIQETWSMRWKVFCRQNWSMNISKVILKENTCASYLCKTEFISSTHHQGFLTCSSKQNVQSAEKNCAIWRRNCAILKFSVYWGENKINWKKKFK